MVWKVFFDDGLKISLKEGNLEKGEDNNTFTYIRNINTKKLDAIQKSRIIRMEEII